MTSVVAARPAMKAAKATTGAPRRLARLCVKLIESFAGVCTS